MKVRISTIPYEGMAIDSNLPLESLNARVNQGDSAGIAFTEAPTVNLKLHRTHTGAEVKGTLKSKVKQPCSACDLEITRAITVPINWILQPATPEISDDDVGLLVYTGDHIDLEEPLQEALILTLSPFWHPPRKADGSCTQCDRVCSQVAWTDKDKSKGTVSLGALLKGAVSKN